MEKTVRTATAEAARSLIGGLCAMALAMGIGRFAFTPILPDMMRHAGLTKSGSGILASANFVAYLAGALWFAYVPAARRELLLIASVAASVVTTALMGLTGSFAIWILLRTVSGLASAGVWLPAGSIALETLARVQKTGWNGFLYSGVGLGIACSGLLVPLVSRLSGWQGSWYAMGLVSALLAVPALVFVGRAGESARAAVGASVETEAQPWMLIRLCISYFIEGFGYSAMATFLVAIVREVSPASSSGAVWTVVGLTAIVAAAIIPIMAGRFRLSFLLITLFACQTVGISLPVLLPGAFGAFGGAVMFGGTFLPISAISILYGRRLAGGRFGTERIVGLLTVLLGIGQALGPLFAGLVAQRHGFYLALIVSSLATAGGEPPRVSRRPKLVRGLVVWEIEAGIRRSFVSVQCGWWWSTTGSTSRSGQRSFRLQTRWAAPGRRCASGFGRSSVIRVAVTD